LHTCTVDNGFILLFSIFFFGGQKTHTWEYPQVPPKLPSDPTVVLEVPNGTPIYEFVGHQGKKKFGKQ